MTEADLSQYKIIKNEINDLEFRIKQLHTQKVKMSTYKVKEFLSGQPVSDLLFNVISSDCDEEDRRYNRISELERKKRDKQSELIEMEHEIHDYIYSMSDSLLRQILIYRYIDGMTQMGIGRRLHMDQSSVSKRINDLFKPA